MSGLIVSSLFGLPDCGCSGLTCSFQESGDGVTGAVVTGHASEGSEENSEKRKVKRIEEPYLNYLAGHIKDIQGSAPSKAMRATAGFIREITTKRSIPRGNSVLSKAYDVSYLISGYVPNKVWGAFEDMSTPLAIPEKAARSRILLSELESYFNENEITQIGFDTNIACAFKGDEIMYIGNMVELYSVGQGPRPVYYHLDGIIDVHREAAIGHYFNIMGKFRQGLHMAIEQMAYNDFFAEQEPLEDIVFENTDNYVDIVELFPELEGKADDVRYKSENKDEQDRELLFEDTQAAIVALQNLSDFLGPMIANEQLDEKMERAALARSMGSWAGGDIYSSEMEAINEKLKEVFPNGYNKEKFKNVKNSAEAKKKIMEASHYCIH
jgi:hypothetical protein